MKKEIVILVIFIKWFQEGREKNFIKTLERLDEVVLTDLKGIAIKVSHFFQNHFTKETTSRPVINGLNWYPISLERADWVVYPFK